MPRRCASMTTSLPSSPEPRNSILRAVGDRGVPHDMELARPLPQVRLRGALLVERGLPRGMAKASPPPALPLGALRPSTAAQARPEGPRDLSGAAPDPLRWVLRFLY